jgi:hypothetical protein
VTHPDKFLEPGASEEEIQDASDRFHQIRQAFDILNDPRKRKVSGCPDRIHVDLITPRAFFASPMTSV